MPKLPAGRSAEASPFSRFAMRQLPAYKNGGRNDIGKGNPVDIMAFAVPNAGKPRLQ